MAPPRPAVSDQTIQLIVDRSVALLVEGWRAGRVVAENYSAVDGTAGQGNSHPLYGWSGLLAMLAPIVRS